MSARLLVSWLSLAVGCGAETGPIARPPAPAGDVDPGESLPAPSTPPSNCLGMSTLEKLAVCVRSHVPRKDSRGYVPPTGEQLAALKGAVTRMLHGECGFALPASIASIVQTAPFIDGTSGMHTCLLLETADEDGNGFVDKGWGMFIVNPGALRPTLNHAVAHPLFDLATDVEAISLFRDTGAGSYLACGSHRYANGLTGGQCDSHYGEADCPHQDDGFFHAAVVALNEFHGATPWTHVQWHGNASCAVDVFGSEGFNAEQPATSHLRALQAQMAALHPELTFQLTPATSECNLSATDNVQGRYLNGAPDICGSTYGGTVSERFAHLEQSARARDAALWRAAVERTWPATNPVPAR